MPIIIDGYNLLRYIEKNFEQFQDITDTNMCRLVCDCLRNSRDSGVVVFDGIGPPNKDRLTSFANLRVMFSGRDLEADDVIENLIVENTAPKRLIVVSDDRRIKTAARKRKSQPLGCYEFWTMVIATLTQQPRRAKEPSAKRHGISQIETDEWLKEFGL